MDGTLRAFAEHVLFARTLADKLRPPGRLSDRARGAPIAVPASPGRPDALALRRAARRPPPGPRGLATERDRGRVLHAFLNHELLALELLALALLRFPDAPARLRRAWVSTLADEQRHLALYLERMRACGVEPGEEPVSAFFWDALADAPDPLAFVAGLSLVLEQANLDFSRRWQRAFLAAGDPETAAVLERVYEDEIRHVRTGARWLGRLKEPGRGDWEAFTAALRFPLTPARARGGGAFDREGRRRAGLDPELVRGVELTGLSKGRVPRVFLFDPHVEDSVAGRTGRSPVADDLAALPLLVAGADDAVVAPRPSDAFLAGLVAAGFALPQIVPEAAPEAFPNRRWGALVPWGWSPATAKALAPLGATWDPRLAPVYDRCWAAERLREWLPEAGVPVDPDDVGVRCETFAEVLAAARGRAVVVKAPISTAGGHRVRFEGAPDPRAARWIERALAAGPVLVEPWLDVVAELSVQADVGDDVRIVGVTRFLAAGGVYRGTVLGPPDLGLPAEVRRFLHGDGRAPDRVVRALGRATVHAGRAAARLGHRGAFAVDALVARGPGGLRVKPIGEINPRWTMGRVALALRDRCAPGSTGLWLFLPVRALGRDPEGFVADAVRAAPLALRDGRIRAGALPTTDPRGARALVTLLWVAERWDEAIARWRAFAPHLVPPGA